MYFPMSSFKVNKLWLQTKMVATEIVHSFTNCKFQKIFVVIVSINVNLKIRLRGKREIFIRTVPKV